MIPGVKQLLIYNTSGKPPAWRPAEPARYASHAKYDLISLNIRLTSTTPPPPILPTGCLNLGRRHLFFLPHHPSLHWTAVPPLSPQCASMNVNPGRIQEAAHPHPSGDRDGEGCGTERRRRQLQQGEISTSEYVCAYRVIVLTKSLLVARAIESGRPPVRSPPRPPAFPSGRRSVRSPARLPASPSSRPPVR